MSFEHADNATKAWVSAIPKKNADGNVIKWRCKYSYTLAVPGKPDYVHIFDKIHFLNKEQINWHGVYKDLSWFICGNVYEKLTSFKGTKKSVYPYSYASSHQYP